MPKNTEDLFLDLQMSSSGDAPLWEHQRKAVEIAADRVGYGLFFEAGTGKTRTALEILEKKYTKVGHVLPTLVICPPIVVENWRREFLKYSDVAPAQILCLTGTGAHRLRLAKAAIKKDDCTVIITNYETLLMEVFQVLQEWKPSCLVVDESHKCKSSTSKRAKRVTLLAETATACRLLLTGTPVLNSPMDLYSQFRILDLGQSFGKNIYVFRNDYFLDKNVNMPPMKHFPDWHIKDGALEKLNAVVAKSSMSVKKADCLDLPPLVRQVVAVELSPVQLKLYKELKKDFIAFLGDKACVAQLAITKALRLQQVVSGYVALKDEHGVSSIAKLDNPRAHALRGLLEDLAPYHKVIVWCVFKENYETVAAICQSLDLGYVEIHGGISEKDKVRGVDIFNDNPQCRVLIGHPASGGIGINLVAASYMIFYSRGFSLEYDVQAEARCYRAGSERHESITRLDLVAAGTIDEVVLEALANKQEISEAILRKAEL